MEAATKTTSRLNTAEDGKTPTKAMKAKAMATRSTPSKATSRLSIDEPDDDLQTPIKTRKAKPQATPLRATSKVTKVTKKKDGNLKTKKQTAVAMKATQEASVEDTKAPWMKHYRWRFMGYGPRGV